MKCLVRWCAAVFLSLWAASSSPTPAIAQTDCATNLDSVRPEILELCGTLLKQGAETGAAQLAFNPEDHPELSVLRSTIKSVSGSPPTRTETAVFKRLRPSKDIEDIKDPVGEEAKAAEALCTAAPPGTVVSGSDLALALIILAQQPGDQRPRSVDLTRAIVHGPLNLSERDIPFDLKFSDSVFCGHLTFNDTRFAHSFELKNSLVMMELDEKRYGVVSGLGAYVAENLRLVGLHAGAVSLGRSEVGGLLSVADSWVGLISINEAHAGRLTLRGSRQQASRVKALRDLISKQSPQEPHLKAALLTALAGFPFLFSMVDLVDATVDGELYADRLHADGPIAGQNAALGQLRLRSGRIGPIDFRNARIARDIDLRGTKITLSVPSDTCVFDRIFKWQITFAALTQAKVGGSVILRHNTRTAASATLETQPELAGRLCVNEMQIGNDVDISALAADEVDLSGSDLGGALELSDAHHSAQIANDLDLRQVNARWLRLAADTAFPSSTALQGAKFRSLDLLSIPTNKGIAETLGEILKPLPPGPETFASYSALAKTLTQMEVFDEAAALQIDREHRITENAGPLRKVWRGVQYVLGGYGYAPLNTLLSTLVATLVGAIVGLRSHQVKLFLRNLQQEGLPAALTGRRLQPISGTWLFFDALVFSLDRLIPLVSINSKHKDISFAHEAWLRAYFVAHALLGYLLAASALRVISEAFGIV